MQKCVNDKQNLRGKMLMEEKEKLKKYSFYN